MLVTISAMCESGDKDGAKRFMQRYVGLFDFKDGAKLKKLYEFLIATFDTKDRLSAFAMGLAPSEDGKTAYFGPNLSSNQYISWLDTFHDPWLIMPLFGRSTPGDFLEKFLSDVISRDPGFVVALALRSRVSISKGKYEAAIRDAEAALAVREDIGLAWYALARGKEGLGAFSEAVSAYNRAISLSPEFCEAHLSLGVALGKLLEYERAVESASRAISYCPDNLQARMNRGIYYARLAKFEQARLDFSFIEGNSKDSVLIYHAKINSASMFKAAGQEEKACAEFRDLASQANETDPETKSSLLISVAICENSSGKLQTSLQLFVEALPSASNEARSVALLSLNKIFLSRNAALGTVGPEVRREVIALGMKLFDVGDELSLLAGALIICRLGDIETISNARNDLLGERGRRFTVLLFAIQSFVGERIDFSPQEKILAGDLLDEIKTDLNLDEALRTQVSKMGVLLGKM